MHQYPQELLKIISFLRKLPGVGAKTAERFAFHLLTWQPDTLFQLSETLKALPSQIFPCETCGCLREKNLCTFCDPHARDGHLMCVISSPKDAFTFEETRSYKGLYHVIGALLSPLDGKTADHLRIDLLKKRLAEHPVKEIILALDSTLEGDATALYLKQELSGLDLHISRLAFGLPMGSSLDYVDGGTLAKALSGRQFF